MHSPFRAGDRGDDNGANRTHRNDAPDRHKGDVINVRADDAVGAAHAITVKH